MNNLLWRVFCYYLVTQYLQCVAFYLFSLAIVTDLYDDYFFEKNEEDFVTNL